MNQKHIKGHLRKKITEWINSIKDESLRQSVREEVIVTGGSIVSLLNGEKPNDYDVYLRTKATVKALTEYYVKQFNVMLDEKQHKNRFNHHTKAFIIDGETFQEDIKKHEGWIWDSAMLKGVEEDRIKIIIRSDGVASEEGGITSTDQLDPEDLMERGDDISADEIKQEETFGKKKKKYRPVFLSPNAITLSDQIQIVIRFYGDAETIHTNFDYIHCTNYYDYSKRELHLRSEALTAIINKELIYSGSKYPICSLIRLRKFLKREWHINAGQILKMSFQISQLDLTDPVVLEDQLVGIDTMYFMQLIDDIEKQQKDNENFEVTNDYILSVIDRIFN